LGDKPIPECGGFPGGVYFLLYERPYLEELDGKEIRWSWGNGPIRSLGQRFDPMKSAPFMLMPMKDALLRR
jgi:hypothetical protein